MTASALLAQRLIRPATTQPLLVSTTSLKPMQHWDASAPLLATFLPAAGDQVELPEEIYLVLRQAVEVMQRGLSVTISPQSRTLHYPAASVWMAFSYGTCDTSVPKANCLQR